MHSVRISDSESRWEIRKQSWRIKKCAVTYCKNQKLHTKTCLQHHLLHLWFLRSDSKDAISFPLFYVHARPDGASHIACLFNSGCLSPISLQLNTCTLWILSQHGSIVITMQTFSFLNLIFIIQKQLKLNLREAKNPLSPTMYSIQDENRKTSKVRWKRTQKRDLNNNRKVHKR